MSHPCQINTQEFEAKLVSRRAALVKIIRQHLYGDDEASGPVVANHSPELNDWAQADLQDDTDIAQINQELVELKNIDAALACIKNGTYGVCRGCKDTILANRLNAVPTAQYCLVCQVDQEKRIGHAHGPSL